MQYHRHPDGFIFVRGPEDSYSATLEQFEADYGFPAPAIPDGWNEEFYEPGQRHFYADGNGAQPLPLVWTDGDLIISALPALLDIQARRTIGENPVV